MSNDFSIDQYLEPASFAYQSSCSSPESATFSPQLPMYEDESGSASPLQFGVYNQQNDFVKKLVTKPAKPRRSSFSTVPNLTDAREMLRMEHQRKAISHESLFSDQFGRYHPSFQDAVPLSNLSRKAYSEADLTNLPGDAPWTAQLNTPISNSPASFEHRQNQVLTKSRTFSSNPDITLLFSLFTVLETQPEEEETPFPPKTSNEYDLFYGVPDQAPGPGLESRHPALPISPAVPQHFGDDDLPTPVMTQPLTTLPSELSLDGNPPQLESNPYMVAPLFDSKVSDQVTLLTELVDRLN